MYGAASLEKNWTPNTVNSTNQLQLLLHIFDSKAVVKSDYFVLASATAPVESAVVSVQTALEPVSLEISTAQKRFTSPCFIKVVMTVLTLLSTTQIDLVTVFDAILARRQTREKLQYFYENLMSNNFRKTAFLKNIWTVN